MKSSFIGILLQKDTMVLATGDSSGCRPSLNSLGALSRMTSFEVVELEQSVDNSTWRDVVQPFVPLIAW